MNHWYKHTEVITHIRKLISLRQERAAIKQDFKSVPPYCPFFVTGIQQTGRWHYGDVIMGTMESQITSLTIVYLTVYSDANQRKHQSSASLAFVWGIHRGPVNSPHKWTVTRKMFPFDDVIMDLGRLDAHVEHHCNGLADNVQRSVICKFLLIHHANLANSIGEHDTQASARVFLGPTLFFWNS